MLIRKLVAGLVLLTFLLGILGAAHYYLLVRIALDPGWPKAVAYAFAAMMFLGLGTLLVHGLLWRRLGKAAVPMSWVAYVWLGVLFYLFVATSALDLATAIVAFSLDTTEANVDSNSFARNRALAIVGLALIASTIALRGGSAFPVTKRVAISLDNFPSALDGFRIVQISDIHIGPMLDRRFSKRLAEQVNALEPDLIAVTGDLVDGRVSHLASEVEPFRAMRARHGIYFVTGNHDYYSGADDWVDYVEKLGWQPLRNASVRIGDARAHFQLVGVDDPHGAMLSGHGGEDLELALRSVDSASAIVLLAHDPSTFRRAKGTKVGLQISGHTHGGQIWPFGWAVRLAVPWVAGHYRVGDNQIYVSCGTGFWGPPMRLGTRSEITEFVLTRSAPDPSAPATA